MKFEEMEKARKAGAMWIFHVEDKKVNSDFYEFVWTNEEKDDLKDEYNWSPRFRVIEMKVVR